MEHRYTDLEACAVDPAAPLVIVDVDEVLAQFMRGFGTFVGRHGFELRVDRFALFQNIYRPGETEHVDMIAGKALFDDFFRDGGEDLLPAEGAADALADLSTRAGVVILTNAPEHGRQTRARWLKTHGFDYPLVINSGPKGPPAAVRWTKLSLNNWMKNAWPAFEASLVKATFTGLVMDLFATGCYRDKVTTDAAGDLRFAERIVVCDGARFDTLVAIPL